MSLTRPKVRLDRLCVEQGLAPTRQRAQALILAGKVLVNEQPVSKTGSMVSVDACLRLRQADHPYVSRGGLKLEAALDTFHLAVDGLLILDVGASTGGFTDCLLQRGAQHVIAVDVGYGQLAWKLRQDPRVTVVERVNARHLDSELLQQALQKRLRSQDCPQRPGAPPSSPAEIDAKVETGGAALVSWPPTMAVIDVSFISLTLVLPAMQLLLPGQRPIIALVKPQFEAERGHLGKGGVVKDPALRELAIQKVVNWAIEQGYRVAASMACPVPGPKGNIEQLVLLYTP
jgi:23S rRNA (cytidine1920-2'-O)/16S rRNA (cytidine1409-2'-O)-methyltransferase